MRAEDTACMHTNEELYRRQTQMLRQFLEKGAISQAQYDKSFHDLTVKMGFALPGSEKKEDKSAKSAE